jgi:predicted phosphodiesterase
MRKRERIFVIPDAHIPNQDKRAWKITLRMLEDFQPTKVVIIGDFGDFESVSHHPRTRPEIVHFKQECELVNDGLDAIQHAVHPRTQVVYIEGNHEYRVVKHTNTSVPHLAGLLNLESALSLAKRRVIWVPLRATMRRAWVSPWGVGYLHSAQANGKVKANAGHARLHAELIGPVSNCKLTIYGHHHGFQHYRSAAGYEAYCCGFLGDYDSDNPTFDYEAGPTPWTTGVLVQEVSGDLVETREVPIRDGKALFGGQLYCYGQRRAE